MTGTQQPGSDMAQIDIDPEVLARRWKILAVLCTSLMVVIVGNTALNIALPTLARELNASISAQQWMVDSYGLVFAGLLLTAGTIGDRYGRKGTLQAGLTVFHVVPTLRGALKAIEAGVDGLVVEGIEGGGFKNPDGASTMVLVPMIAAKVGVPIIAAGGICDGVSMAAAFALGADGVQMGTRMVSSVESPIHDNWKQLVIDSSETDTVVVNRYAKPSMRVLRTSRSVAAERDPEAAKMVPDSIFKLYFGGDMDAFFAFGGQVAGRIDRVESVRDILTTTWIECQQRLRDLGRWAE